MRHVVWILLALLVVLRHDFWFWHDATLVGGLLPVGLAYHVLLSLAAAAVWVLAINFAWPDFADDPSAAPPASNGADSQSGGGEPAVDRLHDARQEPRP